MLCARNDRDNLLDGGRPRDGAPKPDRLLGSGPGRERCDLPPEVAGLLDYEVPLVPLPTTYVDKKLQEHHSDLLFGVHLKAGGTALAYVLLEHKSSPDKGARLQLLRYVVRILVDCYERNQRRLPLPPVLPLLVHQGPRSLSGLGAPSRGRPPSSRLPRSLRAHSTDYVSGRIAARCRCGSAAAGEPKSDRLHAAPPSRGVCNE